MKTDVCEQYVVLETTEGKIKLEPHGDRIIRVVYTREKEFSAKESLMIVPQKGLKCEWGFQEAGETVRLSTGRISLEVLKATGQFTYYDQLGDVLVREPVGGGKEIVLVDVVKPVYDEDTEVTSGKSVDGIRARVESSREVVDRTAYHAKLHFKWEENEALYGLGSHEEGIMNLRGHHQYLYQQNMKAVMPVLVSTKGYGILVDSYSLMTFHDDVYGSYLWMDVEDELDYYFIYGPDFDEIVKGYRTLTGKAPLFPRWAYGYVQSKERYKTQDELIEVVEEYRKRNIPLDLIVLDWKSWVGDLWGQKSLDPERFPDAKGMMEALHKLNARLMVSIWPIMRDGGDNHQEMKEHGYLLANQATYDAFNEQAREMYWKQANEGLFSQGVDAWWCDCTEPFEADWTGPIKPEPEERLRINTGEAKKYLDPEYINAYSLLHSKGIYEGQRKTTEEKRVVNLTRSSYAGQQRYGTITWSGDIAANWKTLRNQIPAGLNFCMTGAPYWTLDIGAFFVGNLECWRKWCGNDQAPRVWFWEGDYEQGCEDLGYRELYVRWFQYGAFLPMFRSHGTDTPREVWRFGQPGDITYDTLVKFDELRYRLMPYIYSLAGKVTHEDYTLMRALPFDFRQDANTYDIADQYMFGPSFLVNPVTEPMYYESGSKELAGVEKARSVYLPAGCTWYDFWTGKKLNGGQTIKAKATLDTMPLYVKAGSLVPMGPKVQHTGEKLDAPIELRIYSGADGTFTLYEDEGDNYNYEKGAFAQTPIQWDDARRVLTFGERQGTFAGIMENRTYRIVLVSVNHGTGLEEAEEFDRVIEYAGSRMAVEL